MAFLSFIFLQWDLLPLKSDWLVCFTVPFSLAEKKMRFRAKDSAICERPRSQGLFLDLGAGQEKEKEKEKEKALGTRLICE